MLQAMGPPAVIVYLELSLFAIAMALCAGVLVAALAAWATSKSTDEPPVRPSPFQLTSEVHKMKWSTPVALS